MRQQNLHPRLSSRQIRRAPESRCATPPIEVLNRAFRDGLREMIRSLHPRPEPRTLFDNALNPDRHISYRALLVMIEAAIRAGATRHDALAPARRLAEAIDAFFPEDHDPCPILALVEEAKADAPADLAQSHAFALQTPTAYRIAADESERHASVLLSTARKLRRAALLMEHEQTVRIPA